eukprot:3477917-Rhodomonas_salina.1
MAGAAGDGAADSRHPPPRAGQINAFSPVAQYCLYRSRVLSLISPRVCCTDQWYGETSGFVLGWSSVTRARLEADLKDKSDALALEQ